MFKKSDPFLLFDSKKASRNLDYMLKKVRAAGAEFRPHFKTHQSLDIGQLCKDKGISAITVSSMGMAEYFSPQWDDITIAFPFNRLWLPRLNALVSPLSAKTKKLKVLVDSEATLEGIAGKVEGKVGVWIEIETGTYRSGLAPQRSEELERMLSILEKDKNLYFEGFYSHPGHSYRQRTREGVMEIFNSSFQILTELKKKYISQFPKCKIDMGDTPCCSYAESFAGIDSISTGNFIFYDMTQVQIGSCKPEDVAVCMAAPVVSKYEDRGEVLIEGGGIHFSKEVIQVDGSPYFGAVVVLEKNGWSDPLEGARLKSISQEHGLIKLPDSALKTLKPGDFIGILPVHSCMTADCMGEYFEVSGRNLDHFSRKRRDSHM